MIIDISKEESRYEREPSFDSKLEWELATKENFLPINQLNYYPHILQAKYQYIALRQGRFIEDQDTGYYSQNKLQGLIKSVRILSRVESRNNKLIRRINKCL